MVEGVSVDAFLGYEVLSVDGEGSEAKLIAGILIPARSTVL